MMPREVAPICMYCFPCRQLDTQLMYHSSYPIKVDHVLPCLPLKIV